MLGQAYTQLLVDHEVTPRRLRGATHSVCRGDVYFKDARAIKLKERSPKVGLLSTERRAKRKGKPAQTELDF